MKPKPKILVTGPPGAGKTTLVNHVVERLPEVIKAAGFVTEEQRGKKGRAGFVLRTLDGQEVPFASMGKGRGKRVGKYIVDVEAFEEAALEAIAFRADKELYIIDEIGPMEVLSRTFCETAKMLLKKDNVAVVATVAKSGTGFIREIKRLPGIETLELSPDNATQLEEEILLKLMQSFVEAREAAQ